MEMLLKSMTMRTQSIPNEDSKYQRDDGTQQGGSYHFYSGRHSKGPMMVVSKPPFSFIYPKGLWTYTSHHGYIFFHIKVPL